MFPNFWSHSLFARFRGSAQLRGSLCIAIPMQACTQWTHSDVWSQLATTPECLFKIGDRQSEKKQRNGDRRAICNSTRGIDAGRGVIRHRGVSDGSDGARPLWRSQSAQTEMFFADAVAYTVGKKQITISWYVIFTSWLILRPCFIWYDIADHCSFKSFKLFIYLSSLMFSCCQWIG
jgi:hypothetical protein